MPIQELAPVTLDEVLKAISQLENEYDLTSVDFLNVRTSVPDDDAAEWNYLLSQKEALESDARQRSVTHFSASVRIKSFLYGASRATKRPAATTATAEWRCQYDCAA
jgi:hypothetical protein